MYSESEIRRINKIPILDVAEKLNIIVKRNKALCFLHEERTPSLSFNIKKNYWHCFGCNNGGSVISLVQNYFSCSFVEAVNWLGGKHIELQIKTIPKKQVEKKKNFLVPNPKIYQYFHSLCIEESSVKNFYCTIKKIEEKIFKQANIRLLGDAKYITRKLRDRYSFHELMNCGIFSEKINRETGEIFYSLYWFNRNTAIIPFFDEQSDIIYLKGRLLSGKRRHLNLKNVQTDLYNRSILSKLQKNDSLFICEGETDTLSALSLRRNAIGLLGASSFKKEYVELLKDYRLTIIPDNDSAGIKFMRTIRKEFEEIGKRVEIIYLNGVKDFNEYYIQKRN